MDRSTLKAKIAALRNKTVANGCTEAEALAAAERAADLMIKHGLSDADMTMVDASVRDERGERATWRMPLLDAIARCTNTALIVIRDGGPGSTHLFVGREPGPEIALYLRDLTFRAVETAIDGFKDGAIYRARRETRTRRRAVSDFSEAMAARLSERLGEMFGPALNPTHKLEAKAALASRFPKADNISRLRRDPLFDDARRLGRVAGQAVPLSHGVAGQPTRALLGFR